MANDPYLTPVTWMANTAATTWNVTTVPYVPEPAPKSTDEDEYGWLRRRVKEVEWQG